MLGNHVYSDEQIVEATPVNPKSCKTELFESVQSGLPLYWAQRLLSPSEARHFLTDEEILQGASFSSIDVGKIDYAHEDLKCLLPKGVTTCKSGDINCHASCTVALICSKNKCSILPSKNISHREYFEVPRGEFNDAYNDFVLDALRKIVEHNRSFAKKESISVVNMSVRQIKLNKSTKDFFEKIESNNHFNIVWATGNEYGREDEMFIKHPFPFVIPVSAMSMSRYSLADYSNFGHSTMMSAPSATHIKSIRHELFGGTSAAAPLVSGALLLAHKVNPDLNATVSRSILKATAQDLGPAGKDKFFGYGMPNLPLIASVSRSISLKTVQQLEEKCGKNNTICLEKEVINYIQFMIDTKNINIISPKCNESGIDKAHSQLQKLNELAYPNITIESLKHSKTCEELACRFDALNAAYLIHEKNDMGNEYRNQLCTFYKSLDIEWGVYNYCSISDLIRKEPEHSLDYAGPGVLIDPKVMGLPEWGKLVESVLEIKPEIVIQYVLNEPAVIKVAQWRRWVEYALEKDSLAVSTDILSTPDAIKSAQWKNLVERALKIEPYSVVVFVLSKPEAMKSPEWEGLVGSALEEAPSAVAANILSKPEAMESKYWTTWVHELENPLDKRRLLADYPLARDKYEKWLEEKNRK